MLAMAADKPKRGRPKGKTPTYTIHVAIDVEVGRAFDQFVEAQPFGVKLKSVVEEALKLLLTREGYWPAPK